MSRVYDNWERLVAAVIKRDHLRQLALCESFSSSIAADFSSRFSFDSSPEDVFAPTPVRSGSLLEPQTSVKKRDEIGPTETLRRSSQKSKREANSQEVPSRHSNLSYNDIEPIEYEELKKATKNFRPGRILEQGAFGNVSKGWIDERTLTASNPGRGMAVAIKMWKVEYEGFQEWWKELKYLSQLRHPNLVKLVAYCLEEDNMILVYEFMPKGSLDNHLFKGLGYQSLSWATRIKVAIGAAKGLSILHDNEKPVIHRDFKTASILLDAEFNARLSNFGLAIDGPTGDMTQAPIVGTLGYAAPEYIATGFLTEKCDVYAFGVVLLELLTGRPVVDTNRPIKEQNLVDWATPYLRDKRKLLRIMDPRLYGQYPNKGAYTVATIALQCLSQIPRPRPRMSEVSVALEKTLTNSV